MIGRFGGRCLLSLLFPSPWLLDLPPPILLLAGLQLDGVRAYTITSSRRVFFPQTGWCPPCLHWIVPASWLAVPLSSRLPIIRRLIRQQRLLPHLLPYFMTSRVPSSRCALLTECLPIVLWGRGVVWRSFTGWVLGRVLAG